MGVLSRLGVVIPKRSYGGFKSIGCGYPQISAPPSGETMRQTPKSFRGARTCSRSSITVPGLVGSDFNRRQGSQKRWVLFCLFVCPSRFWMSEIVRPISPSRRESTETILIPLDRGRFVVVHPCSTFSDCCQLATPLNAEVQKMAKIGGFHHQRATK